MAKKKGKRRNIKSKPVRLLDFLIIMVVILALILSFGMIINNEEGKADLVNNEKDLENEPQGVPDFPSTEEGTLTGKVKPNYFKEPIDQIIVLFASTKIPGLSLIYYPFQQRLVGGSPQMLAEDISLFDGSDHEITYTFKNGEKQALYYDGKQVASSDFKLYYSLLTGMITGVPEAVVSNSLESVQISSEKFS